MVFSCFTYLSFNRLETITNLWSCTTLLIELYYLKMFLEKIKGQVNQTLVIWFNFLENRIAFIRSQCLSVLLLGRQLDSGSAVVEMGGRKRLCQQKGAVNRAGGASFTSSWPADQWWVLSATENVAAWFTLMLILI